VKASDLVGKPVVLRGLPRDTRAKTRTTATLPVSIGLVTMAIDRRHLMIQLHMGGSRRWNPNVRICLLSCVVREATAREAAIGIPVGPLPPAVAA
jgi:hypothetical protein